MQECRHLGLGSPRQVVELYPGFETSRPALRVTSLLNLLWVGDRGAGGEGQA